MNTVIQHCDPSLSCVSYYESKLIWVTVGHCCQSASADMLPTLSCLVEKCACFGCPLKSHLLYKAAVLWTSVCRHYA